MSKRSCSLDRAPADCDGHWNRARSLSSSVRRPSATNARSVGAAAGLLAGLLSLAPTAAAATSVGALPNGVRIVVDERPATETVAIRIVIGGGSLDLPPARRAVAALHARLLERGSEGRAGTELARAVEALGGRFAARAQLRHESLILDAPEESFEAALELLAEVAFRPRLDAADLEKEKDLLIGSISATRDDPSSFLYDELYGTLFPGHSLGGLTRLQEQEIRSVTAEEVQKFQSERLKAERVALVVVGRCDRARVEQAARPLLGWLSPAPGSERAVSCVEEPPVPPPPKVDESQPPTGEPRPATGLRASENPEGCAPIGALAPGDVPAPSPLSSEIRKRVRKRTTQPEIVIALPTAGISDEEMPAYAILRHILGGFQERLSTEIREKRGYAYWLQLDGLALPTAGWIGVRTGARKKNLGEIERLVRTELARIVSDPVSAEELERARRYLATAEARIDATNASRAAVLSVALVDGRPVRTYEERIARLEAVSADDVLRLARRLFEGKHLAALTLY